MRRSIWLKIASVFILAVVLFLVLWRAVLAPTSPYELSPTSEVEAKTEDIYAKNRKLMVDSQIRDMGLKDQKVLEVMEKVPRHEFVLPKYLEEAYADHPLPIGYGQTISQPYIVALMTQLLDLKRDEKVLEIGTGSGYQAAVLAEITDEVYTIEIIPELAESAKERLERLGYTKIHTLNADGYYGWEEYAPFDAIIVTAAPDHIPSPLIKQLKDGGRMVIPVGPPGFFQTLWHIEKRGEQVVSRSIGGVTFVPLTGGPGAEPRP